MEISSHRTEASPPVQRRITRPRARDYSGPLGILAAGAIGLSLLCSVSAMAMGDLNRLVSATIVPLNLVDLAVSNLETAAALTEQVVTVFVPTETLQPTSTLSFTPLPSDTNTATLVPTRGLPTRTPTRRPREAPTTAPTRRPSATATRHPTTIPSRTSTPIPPPTRTNTPVPTVTNTPQPTATDVPPPTATDVPPPTATNVPPPTATNVPPPTATNVPPPTATNGPADTQAAPASTGDSGGLSVPPSPTPGP